MAALRGWWWGRCYLKQMRGPAVENRLPALALRSWRDGREERNNQLLGVVPGECGRLEQHSQATSHQVSPPSRDVRDPPSTVADANITAAVVAPV